MSIALSILIPSVHTRWNGVAKQLQAQIWSQYRLLRPVDQNRVEIIMLTDNKVRTIGEKRNDMVALARGDYIAFIDDDDVIEDDYLQTLLNAAYLGVDVVTFLVSVTVNGGPSKKCRYSKDFTEDRNMPGWYERLPNHLMCVKRELALQVPFPTVNFGEDAAYAKALLPLLKSEQAIDRVLYHYVYNEKLSETR